MTPALTEAATQGPAVHFSPSLSFLSSESSSCLENSMEQSNLSKANGSAEQCLQTDFMSLKHVGSPSSAHYQTVFLLTSSAALNLQNKSSSAWKMEERDMCRQRFHTKKDSHPLLAGVTFQPERKVKRELFPGTVNQLLADVHKLWDITVSGTPGSHIPKCILNGRKEGDTLAAPTMDSAAPAVSGLADVPKNISTPQSQADSLLLRCLSQQQALLNRAKRNRKRLQALLAKQAAEHCTQQIRCFVNHRMQAMKVQGKPARLLDSNPSKDPETSMDDSSPATDTGLKNGICHTPAALKRFSLSTGRVLRHMEQELDSDATGSSSDDDSDGMSRISAAVRNAEWSWLSDRARVGSRWAWLQAQISDLEYKIQQLTDLNSQIRSTKGTVMLEDHSKGILRQESPLPDPGTLLSSAGGLRRPTEGTNPSSAKDLEMSPSSPTLLLRNIEKQSAQLTEMVSSLIVPVSISPNQTAKSCGHKRVASGFPHSTAGVHEEGPLSLNGFCEQQVKRRKKIHVKATSISGSNTSTSARTKALQTFHKRKLYRLTPECRPVHLALFSPEANYPRESLHKTKHHGTWTSCDKLHRSWPRSRNVCQIDPFFHPVLSLPFDLPLHLHFNTLLKKNSDIRGETLANTLLKEELDGFPSSAPGGKGIASSCTPQTRYEMRRRERRHVSETEADTFSSLTVNTFQNAVPVDDVITTPPSTQKSSTQRILTRDPSGILRASRRRLKSESSYDIDNIVIPMSLVAPTKVEKLQYKEIITPSWKVVVLQPLNCPPGEELEDLSDEAYFTRHEIYEQKEKARWSFWEESKWPKRGRSSSNSFGPCSGSLLPSNEGSSSPSAFPLAALGSLSPDTDGSRTPQHADEMHQEKVEQWPQRTFPLTESAASALRVKQKALKNTFASKTQQPPTVPGEEERQSGHADSRS